MASKKNEGGIKIIARNRKAHYRFAIIETLEAGLVLSGHEVKSLRDGQITLDESLVREEKGELFLFNAYIPPYSHLTNVEYNPTRNRKLLLHRKEIKRLSSQVQVKGMTMVPLEIYFKNGIAKVLIALAKGKNTEDKRETIKKRESDKEIARNVQR